MLGLEKLKRGAVLLEGHVVELLDGDLDARIGIGIAKSLGERKAGLVQIAGEGWRRTMEGLCVRHGPGGRAFGPRIRHYRTPLPAEAHSGMEGVIGVSAAMLGSAFLAAVCRPGASLAKLVLRNRGGALWGLGEAGWASETEGR